VRRFSRAAGSQTGVPGMMTRVAITVAYVYSTAVVFGLEGMDFYWGAGHDRDVMLLKKKKRTESDEVGVGLQGPGLLVSMMPKAQVIGETIKSRWRSCGQKT